MKRFRIVSAIAAFAMIGCVAFSACTARHEHNYEWTTLTEPTCESAGTKQGVCTICGKKTKAEGDPALGHDWVTDREIRPATCAREGEAIQHCSRCGTSATNKLPVNDEHNFRRTGKVVRAATCTEEALVEVKCTRCSVTTTVTESPLGHAWAIDSIERDATCTEDGLMHETCEREGCGETRDVTVPAHGHERGEVVYVSEPSFDSAGSKYYKCSICGEKIEGSDVTIPQLEANTPITYEFRLVRNNEKKSLCNFLDLTGTVKKSNGDPAGTVTFKGGSATIDLLPETYTIAFSNLPAGVTVPMASVSAQRPSLDITVRGELQPAASGPLGTYKTGSVMHDFTVTDINETKLTLSELLQTKDIVVLTYFYADCQPCQNEFTGMQNAYAAFSENIAIVAIDTQSDSVQRIRDDVIGAHGLTFNVCAKCDVGDDIFLALGTQSTPTTIVIDKEGFIVEFHAGSYLGDAAWQFRQLFSRYAEPNQTGTSEMPATAPEKSRYFA